MVKRTFKFVDYDGNERVEEHWFNLDKSEAMKLELGTTGGLTKWMGKIIEKQSIPEVMDAFEKIILASIGEKTPDGRGFVKSEKITNEFKSTKAYDQLFMSLITDDKAAAEFINGVMEDTPSNNIPAPTVESINAKLHSVQ